jgi:hypothetical protein
VNKDETETLEANRRLLKMYPILTHLNIKFSSLYILKKTYPLMAAQFANKSFKLCDSSAGYL